MAPKRQRQSGEGSSAQEDEPGWTSNGLSTFPERRRPILYKEKIAKLKSINEAIVAERNVKASDFRCFGLTEGFERLGWEAIFTMNAGKEAKVYINEIVEWMSTLKRVDGDNPPWSVKLIGVVKGVSVEFSLRTVREIIPIDSLEREEYDIRSEAYIKGEEKGDYRAHPASGSSSSRDNPEVVDPFDTRDLAQALYEEFFGPNH